MKSDTRPTYTGKALIATLAVGLGAWVLAPERVAVPVACLGFSGLLATMIFDGVRTGSLPTTSGFYPELGKHTELFILLSMVYAGVSLLLIWVALSALFTAR